MRGGQVVVNRLYEQQDMLGVCHVLDALPLSVRA